MRRPLDDQLHADRGRQVDDDIGLRSQSVEHDLITETGSCEVEPGMIEHVLDVLQAAGGEVVESEHAVSTGQKRMDKMGADESGGSGDEPGGWHCIIRAVIVG